MKRRLPWILAFVAAIPVVVFAGAVGYVSYFTDRDHAHRMEFDAEKWRLHYQEDPSWPYRLRMVDDLIADKRLDGLTRRQTEHLLGSPDDTEKWKDWELVYRLGPERWSLMRIDWEWLVIRFDVKGRVSTYQIVVD